MKTTPKKVLGIIPARYASSRFPGKPLADIGGKSMLQRVFEQAGQCAGLDSLVVATDDARIARHASEFGAQVLMTRSDHASGTDRCAEVAVVLPEYDVYINIQGDEPFIDPGQIDLVVQPLIEDKAGISTLARPLREAEALLNPNIVKVVFNQKGHALYFSRSPIPHVRGLGVEEWPARSAHYQHLGLYGFQRLALLQIAALPPSPLELLESLEQLRWLDHGLSIFVALTEQETLGVDTPEDIAKAMEFLKRGNF